MFRKKHSKGKDKEHKSDSEQKSLITYDSIGSEIAGLAKSGTVDSIVPGWTKTKNGSLVPAGRQTTPWFMQPDGKSVVLSIKSCHHSLDKIVMGKYYIYLSGHEFHQSTSSAQAKRELIPELSVYLDKVWMDDRPGAILSNAPELRTNSHYLAFVSWPDRGVISLSVLHKVVVAITKQVQDGKMVEIGCWGGHGRTGTLAACVLGVLESLTGTEAIQQLRDRYCKKAIESESQVKLIEQYLRLVTK